MKLSRLALAFLLILPVLLIGQPKLSVWQVNHKSATPIFPHGSSHGAVLWDCGYDYYFEYPGDNASHQVILHLLNEGTDTLVIQESSFLKGDQGYNVDLLGLTGEIKLAPNYELQLIVKFKASSYSNQTERLIINSNDPISGLCAISFEVGFTAGTYDTSDPCSCDNIITASNSFGYLFRDTLILSSVGGNVNWNLSANNNSNGFLDMTGSPIMPPLSFGSTNNTTIKYVFYRLPNEIVNINFSGGQGNYTSPSSCAPSCTIAQPPSVPTLSEWGMFILFILMITLGVVAVRSNTTYLT